MSTALKITSLSFNDPINDFNQTEIEIAMMKKTVSLVCMSAVILLFSSAIADGPEVGRFEGQDSGKSPVFTVVGPWTLDWSVRSEFPLSASIEIRLLDHESGEFVGRVAELEGTGRGLRLFEDSGSYQIVIVGRSVSWEVEISEVSKQQAAQLERSEKGRASLLDSSRRVSLRVPADSFVEWRPESNEALVLFESDRVVWRISFSPGCPGLESATAISFVTPMDDRSDQYDSILLADGTRCYFAEVIPGAAP